jgi:hypothetical protein
MSMTEKQLAQETYDEAVRVTEAFRIQYRKRKHADYPDDATKAKSLEESLAQMEAAERREYAAWEYLNHLRAIAVKRPWSVVT